MSHIAIFRIGIISNAHIFIHIYIHIYIDVDNEYIVSEMCYNNKAYYKIITFSCRIYPVQFYKLPVLFHIMHTFIYIRFPLFDFSMNKKKCLFAFCFILPQMETIQ